jgi:hypothetical protein
MLFLLNDAILTIDLQQLTTPAVAQSVGSMTLAQVTALGQEMFSEAPRLQHHTGAASAIRLATLITAKNPDVNAALFSAPSVGCAPSAVTVRFCKLGLDMIHDFKAYQAKGQLTKVLVDYHVWGKLRAAVA